MRAHKHKRKARSERKAEFRRQYKEELEKKKRKIEGEKKRKKIVKKKKEASPEGSNEHSSSSVVTAAGKKAKIKEEIAIREEKRKKKSKRNRRKQQEKQVAGKAGLAAKKIMKTGATGLTHTIEEVLQNDIAGAMVKNSEFIFILKSSKTSVNEMMSSIEGMKPELFRFMINAPIGTGILKHGAQLIPINGRLSESNPLSRIFNTDPHKTV